MVFVTVVIKHQKEGKVNQRQQKIHIVLTLCLPPHQLFNVHAIRKQKLNGLLQYHSTQHPEVQEHKDEKVIQLQVSPKNQVQQDACRKHRLRNHKHHTRSTPKLANGSVVHQFVVIVGIQHTLKRSSNCLGKAAR